MRAPRDSDVSVQKRLKPRFSGFVAETRSIQNASEKALNPTGSFWGWGCARNVDPCFTGSTKLALPIPTPPVALEAGTLAQVYIDEFWQTATPEALGELMKDGRTQRRLAAQDRRKEMARARAAKMEILQNSKAEADHRKAVRRIMRELMRELGLDKPDHAWGRTFIVRAGSKNTKSVRTSRTRTIKPSRMPLLPAYKKALLDARGREAVYLNITYLGQNSKGWRTGLAADHAEYCGRVEALEDPESQLAEPIANIARNMGECTNFWNAVEPVELGYRANAKVQYRFVGALPHELNAAQRREAVRRFCEQAFGRYGLAYTAFVHEPDAEGDSRNFHFHVLVSQRQCARIGDNEWAISEEKVTEIFTPEGLKEVRFILAAALNRQCHEAGFSRRFTHKSYRERGLDAVATEKLGPARTAAFRNGESVAMAERNSARVTANVAGVRAQFLRGQIALAEATAAEARRVQNQIAKAAMMGEFRAKIATIALAAHQALQTNSAQVGGASATNEGSEKTTLTEASMPSGHCRQPKRIDAKIVETVKRIATESAVMKDVGQGAGRPRRISRAAISHLSEVKKKAENVQAANNTNTVRRMPSLLHAQLQIITEKARRAAQEPSWQEPVSTVVRDRLDRIAILAADALEGNSTEQKAHVSSAVLRRLQAIAAIGRPAPTQRKIGAGLRSAIADLVTRKSVIPEPLQAQDFAAEAAAAREIGTRLSALKADTSEPELGKSDDTRDNVQASPSADYGRSTTNQPASSPLGFPPDGHQVEESKGEAISPMTDQSAQAARSLPPSVSPAIEEASGAQNDAATTPDPEGAKPAPTSSAARFLALHKGKMMCVTRSPNGIYLPHQAYRNALNLKVEEFGDHDTQRELKDRFDDQEIFLRQVLPDLVRNLDHKSIYDDLGVIRSVPLAQQDAAKAWLATPFAERIRTRAMGEGSKKANLAVYDWQSATNDNLLRFELAVRAQNWQERWPNSHDASTLRELRADAEKGRANALRPQVPADGSSADDAADGNYRHPANPADGAITSASKQPDKAPAIQDEIDDWLDDEFDDQQGSSPRAVSGAKSDRKQTGPGPSPSGRSHNNMTEDDAAFCRSAIPHLVKNIDAEAVDAGDEAVIAKLAQDQQAEARRWTAHHLWQLLLQRLREAGRRRTDADINNWQAEDRAETQRRFQMAWQAQRQFERWPTDLASQTRQHLDDDAARHQALLNRQAAQQQQRGW